jgi:hypothetical protein
MANCPVCDAPVKGDFGLIECDQCGAQLLIHVDGRVEYSGNQTGMSHVEDGLPLDGPAQSSGPVVGPPAAVDAYEEQPDFLPEEDVPQDAEEPAHAPQEFEGLSSDEQPQAYKPPGVSDSPDLSDIAEFGNSENLAGDSSLRYNLLISGIDTVDVREALREALTDRKFVWDIEPILRSIRQGEVRIANVTPVKAYILISRLRGLPIQVKWEQYATHQA